jgi:HSP20 family protein
MVGTWDEMLSLERRVDELMRTFFGSRTILGRKAFAPPTDVFEREGDLVIRTELPGLDPAKDVKVSFEDGAVVIAGERRQKEEIEEDTYYRMETSYGAFTRRVPLPEGVDESTITAEYEDGVLQVVVPKAVAELKAPRVREIPVRTAKAIKAA